ARLIFSARARSRSGGRRNPGGTSPRAIPVSTSATRRRYSGRARGSVRASAPRIRNKPFTDWTVCLRTTFGIVSLTMAHQSSPILADGLVYANGAFRASAEACVSVFDHGLLYGDGVFEGIRAYNGRVFKLERHIERLFDSAKAIRLDIPHTQAEVCDIVVETCRRNDIQDGYIRLVVTRGPGDLGIDPRSCRHSELFVIARPQVSVYRDASAGIRMITSTFRRNAIDATSPSIKSLNYLNNILARIEANDRGADEAVMLDAQGYVAEATVDNLFIVTDRE